MSVTIAMVNLLQDYLVHLSTESTSPKKLLSVTSDIKRLPIASLVDQIQSLIDSEQKDEPFANLPDTERRLFTSLKDATRNEDNLAIEFDINELSTATLVSQREHEEAIRGSRVKANWGITVGVAGIVIGFIISLYSSYTTNKAQNDIMSALKGFNQQSDVAESQAPTTTDEQPESPG
jgi:hypothetical protein